MKNEVTPLSASTERRELMHQRAGEDHKQKTRALACGAVRWSGPFIMNGTLDVSFQTHRDHLRGALG